MDRELIETLRREVPDMRRLKLALDLHRVTPKTRLETLRERQALKRAILERALPDGTMRVEESGMDCDCVKYWGRLHTIYATAEAFDALMDEIRAYADGPFNLRVLRIGEEVEAGSRDLVMEAYEDGHPHVVYGGVI